MNKKIGNRIKIFSSDKRILAEILTSKEFQKLFSVIFMIVLLTAIVIFLSRSIFFRNISEAPWFLIMFFALWLYGVLQFLLEGLWAAFGKESIIISCEELKHRRSIFGIGFTKSFNRDKVKDIRASGYFESEKPRKKYSNKYGLKLGTIAIDCDDHVYRFGIRLKENEAIELTVELKNFLTKASSWRHEDRGST